VWALEPSAARDEETEGKEACRRAVAGLTLGGEQTVLRAASLCLCETRRGIGGRQDSTARMPMGVDEKQLVAHLCTLCQKVLSLVNEPHVARVIEKTKPINPNVITKESYGTGKYPLSQGVLLRGAKGHSNSEKRKVIQLIREESLHKVKERKTLTRYTLIKPWPRKTHGTRRAAGWGESGEWAGRRVES